MPKPCEPSTTPQQASTADDSLEWLFPLGDINETSYPQFIQEVGALAMGSATYEWMVHHVIKLGSENPGEWPYTQPKGFAELRYEVPARASAGGRRLGDRRNG